MPIRVLIAADEPVATALAEYVAAAGFARARDEAEADMLLVDADAATGMIQHSTRPALYLCDDISRCPAPALQKPVRLAELVAALKRLAPANLPMLGDWVFDAVQRSLKHAQTGAAIALTEKESALLASLLAQPGIKREALLENVWGYGEGVDTHTLETHFYRLRVKLKDVLTESEWAALTAEKAGA